ncbi:MAG: hypothetical protein QOG96_7042 [Pseudonocardiales bacterium]|nr:hypothetical protein [Pseudonocardiales bacterium]
MQPVQRALRVLRCGVPVRAARFLLDLQWNRGWASAVRMSTRKDAWDQADDGEGFGLQSTSMLQRGGDHVVSRNASSMPCRWATASSMS